MRISEELARELAYCDIGQTHKGFKVVHNALIGTTRWGTRHLLVIQTIGERWFWGHFYTQGATENQWDEPFDYMGVADFVQYHSKPVQSVEWCPVTEEES